MLGITKSYKLSIRWTVAVVSILLTIGMMFYTVEAYRNISPIEKGIRAIDFNQLTALSIKAKMDTSSSLFNLGLLSLGALWGLIIAKKDEAGIVLSTNPEIITFCCATLLLLLSLSSHILYTESLTQGFKDSVISFKEVKMVIDVFHYDFVFLFYLQTISFVVGLVIAIWTLFAAHKLSDGG